MGTQRGQADRYTFLFRCAAGFNRTAFCTKMASAISRLAKGSLTKLVFGYVIITVLLAQFIQSAVVVFGIVAPMLAASAEEMGIKPSKVMFPVGVSSVVTCCTLPLGAGATVAAELNGYIESYGYTAYTVGLLDPVKGRLPMLIIMILYSTFVATKLAPDKPMVEAIAVKSAAAKEPLPALQEKAAIAIFFADAIALMFASKLGLTNWQVTVIGAVLMVPTPFMRGYPQYTDRIAFCTLQEDALLQKAYVGYLENTPRIGVIKNFVGLLKESRKITN